MATKDSWQTIAKAKRESIFNSIPEKWQLKQPIPSAKEQRDVTGSFIQQFLDKREIEITETDAVGIVEKTSSGQWKAVDVAEAFCHRASLAHQLVWLVHFSCIWCSPVILLLAFIFIYSLPFTDLPA